MWLSIYMFTRLLLDYRQYHLQYLHAAGILLMHHMLYLTTVPNSNVPSVSCVHTLLPKPLTFIHLLANLVLARLF